MNPTGQPTETTIDIMTDVTIGNQATQILK